jgi:hypothetical protein
MRIWLTRYMCVYGFTSHSMYNADDVSISVVSKEPKYELHVAEDMFKQYDKCIQNSKGSL